MIAQQNVLAYKPGQALNFDGIDDYVNCGTFLTKSYTKEAWINLKPENGKYNNIISGESGHVLWAPHIFGYKVSAGHNDTWNYVQDPNPIEAGWQHYAVTYDADSRVMTLFKNGKQIDQKSNVPNFASTGIVLLGSFRTSSLFEGTMDQVRIWNYARKQQEISDNMSKELIGTEKGLVAYYKFNEGDAGLDNKDKTQLHDFSGNSNNGTLKNFALKGATSNWVSPGAFQTYKDIENYQHRFVEGRSVYVQDLAADKMTRTEEVIELLRDKLAEIDKMDMRVEVKALIKSVPFFIDWKAKPDISALYYDEKGVKDDNLGIEKAYSIYIVNINNFIDWVKTNQPYLVLHELGHALMTKGITTEESSQIVQTYNSIKAKNIYKNVAKFLGDANLDQKDAYAFNNASEYFCEITEAYFGGNDFFPFTRNQLENYDPEGHALVAKIWQDRTITIPRPLFDENKYYRLSTKTNVSKSLDIVTDDNGDSKRSILAHNRVNDAQRWKITRAGNVYYHLTTKSLGDGFSLDADAINKRQGWTGQYWKIHPTDNGYYRLTTLWKGETESLDVKDDDRITLSTTDESDGDQLWTISEDNFSLDQQSSNGNFKLKFQPDGNIVLQRMDGGYIWDVKNVLFKDFLADKTGQYDKYYVIFDDGKFQLIKNSTHEVVATKDVNGNANGKATKYKVTDTGKLEILNDKDEVLETFPKT